MFIHQTLIIELSLKNAGKALASDLLNDLEGGARDITNF